MIYYLVTKVQNVSQPGDINLHKHFTLNRKTIQSSLASSLNSSPITLFELVVNLIEAIDDVIGWL